MDIKPGFYIAHHKDRPESVMIAKVYGREGFYRVDTWQDIITSSGVLKDNLDMEKKPLVFTKRLTELDKEGKDG